jgi:small subunit ribosomal protein S9
MAKKTEEIWATGRRKCAVARVRIKPGTGVVVINGKAMADYLPGDALQGYACQPLKTVELENKIDVTATIDGGGMTGQAGALRHGIARALVIYDETLRAALKAAGMMTRDSRVKERKKSGQPGARRRFQFSKR